jgi:hypothetical protein
VSIFSNVKDRIVERAALSYLNSRILAPYGRVTRLCIDSSAKTVRAEVELNGETAPIEAELSSYEITREGERYFATVKDIQTSREWLTALARERLCRNRLELPPDLGRLLVGAL